MDSRAQASAPQTAPVATGRVEWLITRLVARELLRGLSTLVGVVTAAMLWLHRVISPPAVRAELLDAPALRRALALTLALLIYTRLTATLVRTAVSSRRLAYLRHLPITPRRWRRATASSLLLLNAPWLALTGYGLATLPRLSAAAYGLAWIGVTLDVQVSSVYAQDRRPGRRLARALVVLAALAGALWSERLWIAASLGALTGVAALARLSNIPPEPARSRGVRRARLLTRAPSLALSRLELLTLARRAPRLLALAAGAQLVLAAHLLMAFANGAARPGDGLPRFLMLLGCVAGPALALTARRKLDRDRWYLDSLPIAPRSAALAPLWSSCCLCAPMIALSLATAAFTPSPRASDLVILVDAALLSLWCSSLAPWLGARAEARRALHEGHFAAGALALLAGTLPFTLLPGLLAPLALAPLTALLLRRGARLQRRASATRRRFETTRDDDDHDQP